MPNVTIKPTSRLERRLEPLVVDLYWYDSDAGEMLAFSGSHLEYDYVWNAQLQKYRLEPRATVVKVASHVQTKGDPQRIKRWWNDYQNYNATNAEVVQLSSGLSNTVFDVPDDELDDFTYELERAGFQFEVA
ncbi:MAG: hypothetical protein HC888_01705 [Candidatus Competibacteraceae bacterium]|nr:hypothetical protein [Candidatus Competibacteraceae bacterium]